MATLIFFLGEKKCQEAALLEQRKFSACQSISGSHGSMGYVFITGIRLISGFFFFISVMLIKKSWGYEDTAYEIVQASKCTAIWWWSSRALTFIRLIAISVQENLIRALVLPTGDCLYYVRHKHSAFCPDYIILKRNNQKAINFHLIAGISRELWLLMQILFPGHLFSDKPLFDNVA